MVDAPSSLMRARKGDPVTPAEKTADIARPVERLADGPAEQRGKTVIRDEVVSIIARIAAEEVDGVHQIGASSLRGVFSRGRHTGVEAEVGLKEAAVDVELIATYGYPIPRIAETLRRQIIEQVEFMTGRRVVEVNISVVDVHVPKVEAPQPTRRTLE
jgi:uncharacterized alkaline shock family protein YloU